MATDKRTEELHRKKLMLDFLSGVDAEPEEIFIVDEIRRRIEQGQPKVSKEFVERWTEEMYLGNLDTYYYKDDVFCSLRERVKEMLREAGVKVK